MQAQVAPHAVLQEGEEKGGGQGLATEHKEEEEQESAAECIEERVVESADDCTGGRKRGSGGLREGELLEPLPLTPAVEQAGVPVWEADAGRWVWVWVWVFHQCKCFLLMGG